ncbi:MAG: lysozyme [Xanthobacteraceae bacterium]
MPQHISRDVGLAIVKAFEGCLKPVPGRPGFFTTYYCPAHVLTIGYGHTNLGGVPPRIAPGIVWSQRDCDNALTADMGKFERHVAKLAPQVTAQHRFDALVSWAFNTGGPANSSVWTYARRGDAAETAARLMRWNKARVNGKLVELRGLTRRRACEAALFEGKPDAALRIAGATRAGIEPMAQDVPRPLVPPQQVARKSQGEIAAAAAGGTLATASATKTETQQPLTPDPSAQGGGEMIAGWIGIGFGAAVALLALVLLVRKCKKLDADWA